MLILSRFLLCALSLSFAASPLVEEVPALGQWELASSDGSAVLLSLSRVESGFVGTWTSEGHDFALSDIRLSKDGELSFVPLSPLGARLFFQGRVSGGSLVGALHFSDAQLGYTGRPAKGSLSEASSNTAGVETSEADALTDSFHDRPIRDENGHTLLWAKEEPDGNTLWFDLTDAELDPRRFQFGIGKDTIPSIEHPVFVEVDDPRLEKAGVDLDTPVLGVKVNGVARAYPVDVMSMHEVVNDSFRGQPFAVLW